MRSCCWWLRLIVTAAAAASTVVSSDGQSNRLDYGCSSEEAINETDFHSNRNATFADLRRQLSEGSTFATAQSTISSEAVYAMAQCRDYMSGGDCLSCFDAATSELRTNCSGKASGARAAFDGCSLRYENFEFYNRTSNNWAVCGAIAASEASVFSEEGKRLMNELKIAAPQTEGYFATSERKRQNSTVYGVAQCSHTVTEDGCRGCLTTAYETLVSCFPYTDGRVGDAACFIRYSNSSFFSLNQTTDIRPFLQSPSEVNEEAVIGGAVGGAGVFVIVVTTFMWYMFSRQLKNARTGNILGATELQGPNRYSYKDLKEATNNFSEENKLGQGAFGAVYKARLRNESVVAVKKLDMSYSRAKADFESEVRLISNVHHRNLVRLLGCCSKGKELLLVYEYMENKSLDGFLYGEHRETLSWKRRVDIILGTARGIAYLHEHFHITIIHRDIKPGNILLNHQFEAKIADFGLARLLPENRTHLSTKFAGTLGYAAPEYPIHGHLSEKVDIYSFGIVILEIVSGRKCSDMNPDSTTEYLLREAWKLYERGMHENLADMAMAADEHEVEEVKKMVEIAMLCVQSPPSLRPTMSQIIYMLSNSSDGSMRVQRAIRRPSFSYDNGILQRENGSVSSSTSESHASASASTKSHFFHSMKPSCTHFHSIVIVLNHFVSISLHSPSR